MAQLIWSPRALNDLEMIYNFIQEDSTINAKRFVQQLIDTANNIPIFPLAGRVVPEFKEIRIREKIYKNYRLIYRVRKNNVELLLFFIKQDA